MHSLCSAIRRLILIHWINFHAALPISCCAFLLTVLLLNLCARNLRRVPRHLSDCGDGAWEFEVCPTQNLRFNFTHVLSEAHASKLASFAHGILHISEVQSAISLQNFSILGMWWAHFA